MVVRVVLLSLLLLAPAGGVHAGMSLAEKWRAAQPIEAAEWAALVQGKTLTYSFDGYQIYREQYDSFSNRVSAQFQNGSCMHGYWEPVEDYYCYYWEGDETVCTRHAWFEGELLIQFVDEGQDSFEFQQITDISSDPLSCGPEVIG